MYKSPPSLYTSHIASTSFGNNGSSNGSSSSSAAAAPGSFYASSENVETDWRKQERVNRDFDMLMRKVRGAKSAMQPVLSPSGSVNSGLGAAQSVNTVISAYPAGSGGSGSMQIPQISSSSLHRTQPYHHSHSHHHHHHHAPLDEHDDDDNHHIGLHPDDEDELHHGASTEDDGNSDLNDFSGLDDLDLSDDDTDVRGDGPIDMKRKKPRQREYAPNGRKRRGYHRWAGRLVALLATGDVGRVLKRPGGRIKVQLDYDPDFELTSSEEKLHLMTNLSGQEAIEEIFQAALYVPQLKDLKVNQRVALTRYENATGRIVRLPEEKRALSGLGLVSIALDAGGEIKKATIESLRLIGDDHAIISYKEPIQEERSLGRPTKATVMRKTSPLMIIPLIPLSKRPDVWRPTIRPPLGDLSAPPSPEPSEPEPEEGAPISTKQPLADRGHKRHRGVNGRPQLARGQKWCKSCNAIIGTASRVCAHCGAPCPTKKERE